MGILGKIRGAYWKLISVSKKKSFEAGKTDIYQYKDEIFCNGKNAYAEVTRKYADKSEAFWEQQKQFSIKNHFPETHTEAYKLIFERYLPLYKEKPELMDIGCAAGEWTVKIAPHCKSIDGFEYSQSLVDTANENYGNTENLHFYQADARTLSLKKQYDGALILAMLMYIDDADIICEILKNVYDHLKPGAYLCTRDTLNDEGRELLMMFNCKTGYNAAYWSKDKYYEQFRKAGFEMKQEYLLERVGTRRLNFIHIGNIWQKPE